MFWNIITEIHVSWGHAVHTANDTGNIYNAEHDEPIPCSRYSDLYALTQESVTTLRRAIHTDANTNYQEAPALYFTCNPDAKPKDYQATGDSKRQRTGGGSGGGGNGGGQSRQLRQTDTRGTERTDTNARNASRNTERTNERATRPPPTEAEECARGEGILVWSGSGPIPNCPVMFEHPTIAGSLTALCKNGSTRRKLCRHRNCSYAHVHSTDGLDDDLKTRLKTWVDATEHLAFKSAGGSNGQ